MIDVIPAINAETFDEVTEKLSELKGLSIWAHIDVANGTFAENTLWHDPQDLIGLSAGVKLEMHLMIADLEDAVEDWLTTDVERVLFHISAVEDPESIIRTIHDAEKQAGISISPSESIDGALQYKNDIDFYQILTVTPGAAGQEMQDGWEERIKKLRDGCGMCTIEVDGGMNVKTISLAVSAGAIRIVSASAIFDGNDIEKNIKKLRDASLK